MKILIGTPINAIKDYAMKKWLKNVAALTKNTPADLLLVDNTFGLEYLKKVKDYCQKFGLTNYSLDHLEIGQWQPPEEKIGRSREIIRQKFLQGGYDIWFSWECDQIIPVDALEKLLKIMTTGHYMMVYANTWSRTIPGETNANFGCCLIDKETLNKHSFMLQGDENCWGGGEDRFKKHVMAAGGNYVEIYGIINPIIHLDNPS